MTLIILITISDINRLALVLDAKSGAQDVIPVRPEFRDPMVKGRPQCRPFGITWTSTELLIANNRQLLVFDSQFEYQRTIPTPLQVNSHQMAYHAGRAWVVSPWTNSIIGVSLAASLEDVELDLLDSIMRPYVPRLASERDDVVHFNSILWASGRLYVGAHAFGERSFITSLDQEHFQLLGCVRGVGSSIHGLALHDDELFWLSSGTGEIRSSRAWTFTLSRQGFARGFAVTDKYFLVAISQFRSRHARYGGDSWIQIIDRQDLRVTCEYHLRDTGSINDLRLLDEYDYAHQLKPFWDCL